MRLEVMSNIIPKNCREKNVVRIRIATTASRAKDFGALFVAAR